MNSRCGLVIVMMIEQARKVQLKSVYRVVMFRCKKCLQLQERPGHDTWRPCNQMFGSCPEQGTWQSWSCTGDPWSCAKTEKTGEEVREAGKQQQSRVREECIYSTGS